MLLCALLPSRLHGQDGEGDYEAFPGYTYIPDDAVPEAVVDFFHEQLLPAFAARYIVSTNDEDNSTWGVLVYDVSDTQATDPNMWTTAPGTKGKATRLNVFFRDANGNGIWDTAAADEYCFRDLNGDHRFTWGTDQILIGHPTAQDDGEWGKQGGLNYHDANGNDQSDPDEDVWRQGQTTDRFNSDVSNMHYDMPSVIEEAGFVNSVDHGGDWDGATEVARYDWADIYSVLRHCSETRYVPEPGFGPLDLWLQQQVDILRLLVCRRGELQTETKGRRVSCTTTPSELTGSVNTRGQRADARDQSMVDYVTNTLATTPVVASPSFDVGFGGLLLRLNETRFWDTAGDQYRHLIVTQYATRYTIPATGVYGHVAELYGKGGDLGPGVDLDQELWKLRTYTRFDTAQVDANQGVTRPWNEPDWNTWNLPPSFYNVDRRSLTRQHDEFEVYDDVASVLWYNVAGGFPDLSDPPALSPGNPSHAAVRNTVPDTNRDDIVDIGTDCLRFGPDTGTIVFEPERPTPQVIVPLAVAQWQALPVHAYLSQGGFDSGPTDYWKHPDIEETGIRQAYSLHSRVRIRVISDRPSERIKRVEVVRPRGNVVTFDFPWDPTANTFAALGYPTGINARRTYVLEAEDPEYASSLDYALKFDSGITHVFSGRIRRITDTEGREVNVSQLRGVSIDLRNNTFKSPRYTGTLRWKDGHIDEVKYISRHGSGTVTTTLKYNSNGLITELNKSMPQLSASVAGSTITHGTGTTVTRGAAGSGVTFTTSHPDTGSWTDKLVLNTDGLVTARTVTIGSYSSTTTFQYFTGNARFESGAPLWGKLRQVDYPDDGWERFEYEPDTGWLAKHITPFLNAAPSSPESDCRVEQFSYDPNDSFDPPADLEAYSELWSVFHRPASVPSLNGLATRSIVHVKGEEVERTYFRRYHDWPKGLVKIRRCTQPRALPDDTTNLHTEVELPDLAVHGEVTARDLSAALDADTDVIWESKSDGRTTDDDTKLSLTARRTDLPEVRRVVNAFGHAEVISQANTSMQRTTALGPFGQPAEETFPDDTTRTYESHTWCGPRTITERDKVVTHVRYYPNGLVKQVRHPALGITKEFKYDALGRTREVRRTGVQGTARIEETTTLEHDALARLRKRTTRTTGIPGTTPTNVTTSWNYHGTLLTTTFPDGTTRTEEQYRDRTLRKVGGTAAFPVEYTPQVGAAGAGGAHAAYERMSVLTERPGTGGTPIRTEAHVDMLGQTSTVVNRNGSGAAASTTIKRDPRHWHPRTVRDPIGIEHMNTFSAAGDMLHSGQDLDGDGQLAEETGDDRSQYTPVSRSGFRGVDNTWRDGVQTKCIVPNVGTGSRQKTATVFSSAASYDGLWAESVVNGRTLTARKEYSYTHTPGTRNAAGAQQIPGAWTTTVTGSDGRTEIHTYEKRRLRSVMTQYGQGSLLGSVTYDHNALGDLTHVSHHRGEATNTLIYGYDANRRVNAITPPGKSAVKLQNFVPGTTQPRKVVLSDGCTIDLDYHDTGLLKCRTLALTPGTTPPPGFDPVDATFKYTPQGQLWKMDTVRDGHTVTTEWLYNQHSGRLEGKEINGTRVATYTYHDNGMLHTSEDAEGVVTTRHIDSRTGDLTQIEITPPSGTATIATPGLFFENFDRLWRPHTVRSESGIRHALEYDFDNRVTEDTVTGTDLVPNHKLTRTFHVPHAGIESLGVTDHSAATALTRSAHYTYDDASRLQAITAGPVRVVYEYEPESDLLKHVTVSRAGPSGGPTGTARSDTPTYQPILTRTQAWCDFTDRLESVANRLGDTDSTATASSFTIGYRPNTDRIETITRDDGTAWRYDYSTRGGLATALCTDAAGTPLPGMFFSYNADTVGNLTEAGPVSPTTGTPANTLTANDLNVHVTRTWSNAIEIVGTAAADATVTVEHADTIIPAARTKDGRFAVRLTADNSTGPAVLDITVRAVLAGTGRDTHDTVAEQTRTVIVPPANDTVTTDPDGNQDADATFDYTFDNHNRLRIIESKPTVPAAHRVRLTFGYYPDGRRAQKKVERWQGRGWQLEATHTFIYDDWNPVLETITKPSGGTIEREYIWGLSTIDPMPQFAWSSINPTAGRNHGGTGALVAILERENGTESLYIPTFDHNGNVQQLIDGQTNQVAATYHYSPFGELLATTGHAAQTCPFRFATKYHDTESGLYYFGYRYYNPKTGKWLSRDPIQEQGGRNLTAYCHNDPINCVDPLGLEYWQLVGTHRQYAMMCHDVYKNRTTRVPVGWRRVGVPLGWRRVADSQLSLPPLSISPKEFIQDDSGFAAALYHRSSDNTYVLAFRGTEDIVDWLANVFQGVGLEEGQYKQAIKLALRVHSSVEAGGGRLRITGHSLGGGLATVASLATGAKCVVFNPAGVHTSTLSRHKLQRAKANSLVTAYVVEGEALDYVQEMRSPSGLEFTIPAVGPLLAVGRILVGSWMPESLGTKRFLAPNQEPRTMVDRVTLHCMPGVLASPMQ